MPRGTMQFSAARFYWPRVPLPTNSTRMVCREDDDDDDDDAGNDDDADADDDAAVENQRRTYEESITMA